MQKQEAMRRGRAVSSPAVSSTAWEAVARERLVGRRVGGRCFRHLKAQRGFLRPRCVSASGAGCPGFGRLLPWAPRVSHDLVSCEKCLGLGSEFRAPLSRTRPLEGQGPQAWG